MSSLNKTPELKILENQFKDERGRALKALAKAKAQEKEKIKKGYKWVRVDKLTIKLAK